MLCFFLMKCFSSNFNQFTQTELVHFDHSTHEQCGSFSDFQPAFSVKKINVDKTKHSF